MKRAYKWTTTAMIKIAKENVEKMGNHKLAELLGLSHQNTKALLKRHGIVRSEAKRKYYSARKKNAV